VVKLVFALRRRSDLGREEFQRYWRETHALLVADRAEVLRIRRYVQCHTLETPLDDALRAARGPTIEPYDGVAELWWDSVDDLAAAMTTEEGAAAAGELLADEQNFIDLDASPIWLAEENVVVELAGRPPPGSRSRP
jgi:uncharacterized protein (TIGR02118 family)